MAGMYIGVRRGGGGSGPFQEILNFREFPGASYSIYKISHALNIDVLKIHAATLRNPN